MPCWAQWCLSDPALGQGALRPAQLHCRTMAGTWASSPPFQISPTCRGRGSRTAFHSTPPVLPLPGKPRRDQQSQLFLTFILLFGVPKRAADIPAAIQVWSHYLIEEGTKRQQGLATRVHANGRKKKKEKIKGLVDISWNISAGIQLSRDFWIMG